MYLCIRVHYEDYGRDENQKPVAGAQRPNRLSDKLIKPLSSPMSVADHIRITVDGKGERNPEWWRCGDV